MKRFIKIISYCDTFSDVHILYREVVSRYDYDTAKSVICL